MITRTCSRRTLQTASRCRILAPAVRRNYSAEAAVQTKPQLKEADGLVDLHSLPRRALTKIEHPIVNPAEKYRDQIKQLHLFGTYLTGCMPKYIQKFLVWKDELTIYVAPSCLYELMHFLKDHSACQFKLVVDITAADYPSRTNRFDVVYNMLSVRHNSRIRVKTYASETSAVPSIVPLFAGANWFERETYDLFGVFFEGHPDLRRIMTDYGFEGHPLRKDFPTTGYTEVRYDEEKKRIVYEPLELTQAWRNFSIGNSAWEQVGEGEDFTPPEFKLPEPIPEDDAAEPEKK